jgi:uncharacterized OsmC-like protein
MDADTLRARQGPLKTQYLDDPASASTSVHAVGRPDGPGFSFTVDSWAGPVRAGLHPATGGDGSDACSGDMLLEALVACAGVTMRSVAKAMGIEIRSGTMRAAATFDARGTLAVSRAVPVGLTGIRVEAELDTDAGPDQLVKLAELTERYCVVGQSLRGPVSFDLRSSAAGPDSSA